MRFTRPFDSPKRASAIFLHQQYRKHLRKLRAQFPPETTDEQLMLREYRELLQDFARELQQPDDKVDTRELDRLQREATRTAMKYQIQRGLRGLYGPD